MCGGVEIGAQHAPQQQHHQGGGAPRRRPVGNGPALGVTRGLTVKMRGLPFRVQVRVLRHLTHPCVVKACVAPQHSFSATVS
jgi:hypothetical protein